MALGSTQKTSDLIDELDSVLKAPEYTEHPNVTLNGSKIIERPIQQKLRQPALSYFEKATCVFAAQSQVLLRAKSMHQTVPR